MARRMRNKLLLMAALVSLSGIPAAVDAQGQQQTLVIQGATLIDGTGAQPVPNSVIVIQGNKITAVGRAGQVQIPAGAQTVNANGKWIVPGLWDCYQSYSWFTGELQLNQGVTSLCDVGIGEELSVAHRDAVNNGKIRGPRMLVAISHFSGAPPGALTGFETPLASRQIPNTVEESRALSKRFLAAGADMVQFHEPNTFTPEIVAAGCDEAHKANKPCFLRGGESISPFQAATLGVDIIPQNSQIDVAVQKDGSKITGDDADRYADMDDTKAKALIDLFVKNNLYPAPCIIGIYPTYPKNREAMAAAVTEVFSDPNLRAYYSKEFFDLQHQTRTRFDTGEVKERRQKGYQNMMRFTKMLVDAGGKPLTCGATNAAKVPGFVIHDEMEIWQEAGIKPMQIIQGATKWPADAMRVGDKIGSIEPGRIADLIIVNANPLTDIANLRKIDNVVFDGKVIDRSFHAWYATAFGGNRTDVSVVENLRWTQRVKAEFPPGGPRGGLGGGPAAGGLPDPVEAPPPYIQTLLPVKAVQGAPATTLQIKGGNFVARSRVLFDGESVPYRAVSPTELEVTLDENLLRRVGRFDIVVVNPHPLVQPKWGDGVSNKAHFIVDFKY